LWIRGSHEGVPVKESLKTNSWDRAEQLKREREDPTPKEAPVTLEKAAAAFMAYYEKRISADPVRKYRLFLKQLKEFASSHGIVRLKDMDFEKLALFYGTWQEPKSSTRQKKLERMRAFYRFCYDVGWVPKNYAKLIKSEREQEDKVDPFSDKEQQIILNAECTKRTRAFILVLFHSALRISDVCMLKPAHVVDGHIRKTTIKMKKQVIIPIPPALLSLLNSLQLNGGYYFLQGSSEYHPTQSDYWREVLGELFKDTIPGFHPHRFRHTAAVNWLAAGLTMEEVAALLGSSVKIVEKHYASYAPAGQQAVNEKFAKIWNQQRVALVRVK
jgi:integrase